MHSKYSKDDIYEKGIEMMQERGYNYTSVKDILVSLGIPKGSFYNFFESKEKFAAEALAIYSNRILGLLAGSFEDRSSSPRERMIAFGVCMQEYIDSYDCKRGCLVANLSAEVANESDLIADVVQDFKQKFIELFAKVIAEGQETGELKNDSPPAELAELFYSMYLGTVVSVRSARNTKDFDQMINLAKIL